VRAAGDTKCSPTSARYAAAPTRDRYAQRKGWNIGAVAVSVALHQGTEGRTIERRVKLSAALTAEQQAKSAEICEKTPVTLVVKSGISLRTTLASEDSAAPTRQ
jgi:putative redox protein